MVNLNDSNYIKPIIGFEDYYITIDGKVFSTKNNKIIEMKLLPNPVIIHDNLNNECVTTIENIIDKLFN